MMAFLIKYLTRICVLGMIFAAIGFGGCTKTVRTIENDAFRVIVRCLNPSAFDSYILSVYLEQKGDNQFHKTKLCKIQGPNDLEGGFLSGDLLVLKEPYASPFPAFRLDFLIRVPMECIGTIEMNSDEYFYPFTSNDSLPYSIEYSGNRRASIERTWLDRVYVVKIVDTAKTRHTGVIRIAPVDRLDGELIHEDTLRLSVTWCGEDKAQDILVKLPTSIEEDLEYIVIE